jgi:hypothetical protein
MLCSWQCNFLEMWDRKDFLAMEISCFGELSQYELLTTYHSLSLVDPAI